MPRASQERRRRRIFFFTEKQWKRGMHGMPKIVKDLPIHLGNDIGAKLDSSRPRGHHRSSSFPVISSQDKEKRKILHQRTKSYPVNYPVNEVPTMVQTPYTSAGAFSNHSFIVVSTATPSSHCLPYQIAPVSVTSPTFGYVFDRAINQFTPAYVFSQQIGSQYAPMPVGVSSISYGPACSNISFTPISSISLDPNYSCNSSPIMQHATQSGNSFSGVFPTAIPPSPLTKQDVNCTRQPVLKEDGEKTAFSGYEFLNLDNLGNLLGSEEDCDPEDQTKPPVASPSQFKCSITTTNSTCDEEGEKSWQTASADSHATETEGNYWRSVVNNGVRLDSPLPTWQQLQDTRNICDDFQIGIPASPEESKELVGGVCASDEALSSDGCVEVFSPQLLEFCDNTHWDIPDLYRKRKIDYFEEEDHNLKTKKRAVF